MRTLAETATTTWDTVVLTTKPYGSSKPGEAPPCFRLWRNQALKAATLLSIEGA
jgi:hypothetical protein